MTVVHNPRLSPTADWVTLAVRTILFEMPVDLFFLVPGTVGVEFDIKRGGEHLSGKFFRIVSR